MGREYDSVSPWRAVAGEFTWATAAPAAPGESRLGDVLPPLSGLEGLILGCWIVPSLFSTVCVHVPT